MTVLALAAACGAFVFVFRHPLSVTHQDIAAIEEAVFRRMARVPQRPVHGLSIDNHDPSPEFMARFRDMPSMEPGSHVGLSRQYGGSFADIKTSVLADVFTLDTSSLTWSGPNRAAVLAQAHGSGEDGYLGTYTVERRGKRWIVTAYKDSGMMF